MRNFLAFFVIMSIIFCGCGEENNSASEKILQAEKIDVDLTKLSTTMAYSAVFDIVENPAEYRGKIIKIRGTYAKFHDPAKNEYHHACIIMDETACCMQGMEFELSDGKYPPKEREITLIGKFDTYTIQKIDNPILREARLVE